MNLKMDLINNGLKNCFFKGYLVQSYSSVTHRYRRTIPDFIFIEKPVLYFKRNYQPFETKDTNESNIFTRDHFYFKYRRIQLIKYRHIRRPSPK